MKKILFIMVLSIGALNSPLLAHAQGTGITTNMIGIGQNASANYANAVPQMQAITGITPTATPPAAGAPPPPPTCSSSPMILTGAPVYRLYAVDKTGVYRNYSDSFCLSQGCSHQNALTSTSACTTGP